MRAKQMANFLIYTRIFSNVGREKGSNVKVPHLALQGVSKVFVLIENAMYRTLLATCGSAVFRCLYSLK